MPISLTVLTGKALVAKTEYEGLFGTAAEEVISSKTLIRENRENFYRENRDNSK